MKDIFQKEKAIEMHRTASGADTSPEQQEFLEFLLSLDEETLNNFAEKAGVSSDELNQLLHLEDDAIGEGSTHDEVLNHDEVSSPLNSADINDVDFSESVNAKSNKTALLTWARILIILVPLLFIIAAPLAYHYYMHTELNADNPIIYPDAVKDEVSCKDGLLKVNDVTVKVPAGLREEYNIFYAWSQGDIEYPSAPRAVVVSYPNSSGSMLYEVSLYRNETIAAKDIPSGKKKSNWFDDWEQTSSEGIIHEALESNGISGFYIHPSTPAISDNETSYNTFTYYFAVSNKQDISIYVLEGICFEPSSMQSFSDLFLKCIQSIRINKNVKKKS